MSKHTPAPWLIGYAYASSMPTEITTTKMRIARLEYGDLWTKNWSEAAANARLIATAPEMLAALKLAVKVFDEINPHADFMLLRVCKEAIAKAEGSI